MSSRPLVETLVKALVGNPDEVEIDEEEEMGARVFYVRVSTEDAGKVIGKNGRVVSAIRQVVGSVASKSRERATVRVVTD